MPRSILKPKRTGSHKTEMPNQAILEHILPDKVFDEPQTVGNVCVFGPNDQFDQLTVQSRGTSKDPRICVPVPRPTPREKCRNDDVICKE